MEALKPCPHCGNDGSGPIEDALHVQHNEPFEWNDRHTWTVQCDKCTATIGYFDSEEEAIVAWNRRAEGEPSEAEVERIAEVIRRNPPSTREVITEFGFATETDYRPTARAALLAAKNKGEAK